MRLFLFAVLITLPLLADEPKGLQCDEGDREIVDRIFLESGRGQTIGEALADCVTRNEKSQKLWEDLCSGDKLYPKTTWDGTCSQCHQVMGYWKCEPSNPPQALPEWSCCERGTFAKMADDPTCDEGQKQVARQFLFDVSYRSTLAEAQAHCEDRTQATVSRLNESCGQSSGEGRNNWDGRCTYCDFSVGSVGCRPTFGSEWICCQ